MSPRQHSFWNNWSLKDLLILAGILAGMIHNSATSSDVTKEADNSVERGWGRVSEKLATLTEHQTGQDRALGDHEIRIRTLETRK